MNYIRVAARVVVALADSRCDDDLQFGFGHTFRRIARRPDSRGAIEQRELRKAQGFGFGHAHWLLPVSVEVAHQAWGRVVRHRP
jgi:hypothetical protein